MVNGDRILDLWEIIIFLPELWLSITVCILLVYIVSTKAQSRLTQTLDVDLISQGVLVITIILIMNWLKIYSEMEEGITFTSFNGLINLDGITCLIKSISIMGGIISISISKQYNMKEDIGNLKGGYQIIILLAMLGIILLVSSNDLLAIYLAMELQSLSFYTLATLKRDEEWSTEAGLKYFILGALSSGIYLFGTSLIYGSTGWTNLDGLNIAIIGGMEPGIGWSIGIIFIIIAFLFKLAAAPFHMWAPDVYQGSPTPITAFFAIVPKISILGILIKLYGKIFIEWQLIIIYCAITSMIIGSLGALNQSNLKRLLAYSAISHIGYVLIAFVCGTHISIQALLIYMIIYMLMSIQSFAILLSLRNRLNGKYREYLIELIGLSRSQPILAITWLISLFSLAGIPPLAGFFSKLLVFSAAIQSQFYLLAIIGVLTSVLASIYYIRIIINMYARYPETWNQPTSQFNFNVVLDTLNPLSMIDKSKSIILGITTFLILFWLWVPTPLLLITHHVALLFFF